MGVRTSIYLSDDLHAAVRASGLPVAEIIRRGLNERGPEETAADLAATRAAQVVRADVLEAMEAAAQRAVAAAHEDACASIAEAVERAVRSALRDAQGGAW